MKKITKDALFKNYVETAVEVFWYLENYFGSNGVYQKLVGLDSDAMPDRRDPSNIAIAEEHLKGTWAWRVLSELYEYAVFGLAPSELGEADLVCFSGEIISYLETSDRSLSRDWIEVLTQADARFGLDSGDDVVIEKLALLAAVDVRTVRNAISAGDLISEKSNGRVFVDNKSARNWLIGRRGFKPTVQASSSVDELKNITRPSVLGSFLKQKREGIGQSIADNKVLVFHPSVDVKAIESLESGVFNLTLDTVFPLADFYQLDRNDFLKVIMKVFFHDEYIALTTK